MPSFACKPCINCQICQTFASDMGCSTCLSDSFKSKIALVNSCIKSVNLMPPARFRRVDGTIAPYATVLGLVSNSYPKLVYFSIYEYAIDYSSGSNQPPTPFCGDEISRCKTGYCQICPDGLAWINYDGVFYCSPMPLPKGFTNGLTIYPPSPGNNCWYERHTGNGICYACNYPFTLTPTQSCQPLCPVH